MTADALKKQREYVQKEIEEFDRNSAMIIRSLKSELDDLDKRIAVRESIQAVKDKMGEWA